MKRILIIGASGFVGINLAKALRAKYRVIGTYNSSCLRVDNVTPLHLPLSYDLPIQEVVKELCPSAVIYCAACIDERQCDLNPKLAMYINAELPYLIARVVTSQEGRFIYFSSSKVFSGEKGSYKEDDYRKPQGIYGSSKLRAEELLSILDNIFVFRLGTVYGLGSKHQKAALLNRFLKQMWDKNDIKVIEDEMRSFLSVDEISNAVNLSLECERYLAGTYHLAPPEKNSYYTFAKAVAKAFSLSNSKIMAISGRLFQGELAGFGGIRGKDLTLQGQRFADTFQYGYSGLEASLRSYKDLLHLGLQ